jgi:hypothetical protein
VSDILPALWMGDRRQMLGTYLVLSWMKDRWMVRRTYLLLRGWAIGVGTAEETCRCFVDLGRLGSTCANTKDTHTYFTSSYNIASSVAPRRLWLPFTKTLLHTRLARLSHLQEASHCNCFTVDSCLPNVSTHGLLCLALNYTISPPQACWAPMDDRHLIYTDGGISAADSQRQIVHPNTSTLQIPLSLAHCLGSR